MDIIMASESLYMDVYNDIVSKIRPGIWEENSPLPAERKLCQIYHVSRSTVRRALKQLEQENYIFKKHGNGNFVKPHIFEQPLAQFYSFTDTLKNDGIIIENAIVDYDVSLPSHELIKSIHCAPTEWFHKLTRLRSAKEYPLMLETTYLPKSRFSQIDIDWLQNHSLYQYLNQQYNMRVDGGFEAFYPIVPNTKERLLLHIPANQPCMAIERFTYENDAIIEYTKSIVRGDKYKFKVGLTRE
ncbi:GntR family transcriptional regulator [Lachnospiraceae bacterium ZAX-1]